LKAQVPFSTIAIVYCISIGIQSAPVGIPGEVGVLEVVMTSLYTLLNVDIGVAAAATILTRVITLWLRLLIGGLTVQWLGIKSLKPSSTAG